MENPFSAPRHEMLRLFLESRIRTTQELLRDAIAANSYDEVKRQVMSKTGPIVDEMMKTPEAFARRTENVEFVTALGLSDFYFGPRAETSISFEMKRGFRPGENLTYEEILNNIESATHIDCAITEGGKTLTFQIKRYPQAYLEHTNDAFLKWLDEEIIEGYGNMNGTILVVILQPNTPPAPTAFRFRQLGESITSRARNITFDEIALTYTDFANNQQLAVLNRLFPKYERTATPLEWVMRRFRGQA